MKKYRIQIIVFSVALVLSAISIIVGFSSGLLQHENQLRFLNNCSYEYGYQFSGIDYPMDSFANLNSSYSVKGTKTLKCDKLMQLPIAYSAEEIWGKIPLLQCNEVYLSSNLLALHGLSVGDEITVQSPNSAQPTNYLITGTFSSCYGLYDDFVDRSKGVIIFGLDEEYLLHNETDFVTFQNSVFKASSIDSQLIGLYSIDDQHSSVQISLLRITALMWSILLLTDIMGSFFLYGRYGIYLKKLYRSGMNGIHIRAKLFQIILSPLYVCRIISVVAGILLLIATDEFVLMTLSLIEIVVLLIISTVQKKLIERGA